MTLDLNLMLLLVFAITSFTMLVTKTLDVIDTHEMKDWTPSTDAAQAIWAIDAELLRIHEQQTLYENYDPELHEQRNKLNDTLIEIARRQNEPRLTIVPTPQA